ncbi:MAG: VWA domain-containing protein [Anaerolineae bacterium]
MSIGSSALVLEWPVAVGLAALIAFAAGALELRAGAGVRGAALRALVVGLTALALAQPAIVRGSPSHVLALVDVSASVDDGSRESALAALRARLGETAAIEFGDDRRSPIAEALDLGRRALPDGGRLVLLSDGRYDGASPVEAAAIATDAGVTVDVVQLESVSGRDVAVTDLTAPVAWRYGSDVPVVVDVRASAPTSATLRIDVDGATVATHELDLDQPSRAVAVVDDVPVGAREGPVVITAQVVAAGDIEERNDVGYATTHVAPGPDVLVAGDSEAAVALADALAKAGGTVAVTSVDGLPGRLSELRPWDVLVLVDVSARDLGLDQLAAIEAYVADLGRGLVLTGGRQSYLLGGWESTPLEALAPVRLEAPPRGDRDTVALLLVIDRSASMGTTDAATGISKLDLAREAAALSAEVLHAGDTVAVLAYDDEAQWVVEPTTVGPGRELADVESALSRLETGGGTRILRALETGLAALARLDTPTRHAVLLSDGRDFNPDDANYERVVREARAAGTTLSTIAIGFDSDRDLLRRLASLGRGRYHSAEDPGDLPRLTVEESEILRARTVQTGDFGVSLADGHDHAALAGVDVSRLPRLRGYLAMNRRDGADVVLEAPGGDPLLATWGYGLGRVAAWTSDVGEAWARDWVADATAHDLWLRVAGYVAPAPDTGSPGVTVEWDGLDARVEALAFDAAGVPVNFADATLVVTAAGESRVLPLPQSAPGRYAGSVTLPGAGAYPAAVVVEGQDGAIESAPVALAIGAGTELAPGRAATSVLESVAQAGGGSLLVAASAPPDVPAAASETALWPLLLALAALLWPLEVARVVGVLPRRSWRGAAGRLARGVRARAVLPRGAAPNTKHERERDR